MTADPKTSDIPRHVAIIMDGNRRWAQQRHLPSLAGHKAGYENLKRLAEHILRRGVTYLTIYAWSTENWQRAQEEVDYIGGLLEMALTHDLDFFERLDLRFRWIGSPDNLKPALVKKLEATVTQMAHNQAGQLNLCFNYGARADMVEAVKQLVASGVSSNEVTIPAIAEHLQTAGLPDPDLIIRTSGEQRLSNFLLWEAAYSEFYFSPKLWPDFDEAEFDKALEEYAARKRRFGS